MYIWTAIHFEDQLAELRNRTASISEELSLDNPSLTLPIHTSLAISCEVPEELSGQIINDLADYFSTLSPFFVDVDEIEQNGSIVWLRMADSEILTEIHNHIISLLQQGYGLDPHPFDLDFKFHATLFFGGHRETLNTVFRRIKNFPLPDVITARRFVIGTSPSGQPGTYSVCRDISTIDHALSRIRQMEERLDTVSQAVQNLSDALDGYTAVQPQLAELIRYYESPQWMADYDADNAGLLPADFKRGVLSEDAVYNLLSDHQRLLEMMKQFTKKIEEH